MSVNYKRFIPIGTKLLIVTAVIAALYFVGIPIIKMLLPFIIAGIIAMLIEPLVRTMQKRLKLGRKLSSLLSLIGFLIVFGTIITLIIYKIIIELATLSNALPEYFRKININNEMKYWSNLSEGFYLGMPPEAAAIIQSRLAEAVSTISGYLSGFVSSMLSFVLDIAKVLPESFIFIIITIISTYFISSDKEKIRNFIYRQIPDSWIPKILSLKSDLLFAFIGFIKAQLILIIISITIASIGLSILGVKYAITMGILIGTAELIPVVGTGTFFVPWIIYELFTKDFNLAVGLASVFILGVVVRQLMEPKILGVQIGIYPLVALISIYVGLSLFGIFGMILGPIIVILLRNLNKSGIIRLWKE